ncbi:hypothetical protein HU200_042095 [Digitaria exilis]|uniref:Cysteine-rich receptor-like protein kinase 10 n=1 Tax=Digitaria exilis TaxID=1010633 RepID=A0A835EG94_9POAL|nr:hypothetical protein HU200_042095 [Digitaria exilis]
MARHLILAAVALLAPGASSQDYPWLVCDYAARNFTPTNSRYLANINLIGAALPTNASSSPELFATAAIGAAPDKVWGLALCRGDANASYCLSCLVQASRDLPNACPYNEDAAIYYDQCMLHYSPTGFPAIAVDDSSTTYESFDYGDVSLEESTRFNGVRAVLMNATADYAAHNSTRRYAAGEADMDLPNFPKLYSWAQCTPDLRPARCRRCLAGVIALLPQLYTNSSVGMVLGVRCSVRYQTDPFIDGPMMVRLGAAPPPKAAAPAQAPAPAPAIGPAVVAPAPAAASGAGLVLIAVLPILAAINLVTLLCFWRRRKRRRMPPTKNTDYTKEAEDMESVDSMLMDISTLRAATGDFAESNKLGEGEFGAVYKGVLPDGDEIAVKRMSKSSSQGVEELKNELAVVAKLKHKNLVSLVGVCLEQQERLLVYEFVPNRSLNLFIYDTNKRAQLDWGKRYNIISGIARGLQYLHEDSQLKVVHRNLKASNILPDSDMNPKISDFGLARIFSREQSQAVTNHVVGAHGYMAPEYAMRGNYSVKSDAFSFGVMVLEIVSGRKNKDSSDSRRSEDILTLVWEHWMAGTVLEIVDPAMDGCFSEDDVRRCIYIGLLCVQGNPGDRPMMSSVVMMLGSNTVSLQAPCKPASFASNVVSDVAASSV